MNDLISRQAAIDTANDWLLDCLKVQKQDRSCGLIRRLEDLPSAQQTTCKDCKHYNAGFECLIEGYGIERDKDWYCADAERKNNV